MSGMKSHAGIETVGRLYAEERIVADDFHAQVYCGIGYHNTDCAKSDDT